MRGFLFTDIAGSTALWEQAPGAMERAYQRHDAILREAAAAHGGVVFKVIGDAFQIAFPTPAQALRAAIEAQRQLVAEPWPLPHPLWVRMALHTGEIAPDPAGDYRSPILNRLGRLLGAGHGGQILLSGAMTSAVREGIAPGWSIVELGRYRLRDLPEPDSVAQVVAPGLPAQFPPLHLPDARHDTLPRPANPIIGRDAEIERLAVLLNEPTARLVTLTGTGGTGKTRLALEAAARCGPGFADGVVFVDLAAVSDPALLLPAVAEAIGLRASGERSSGETLLAYLADRELLLLLDNFEQIIGAAPDVARLLAASPASTILITSREALRIRAERIVPVPPLALPAGDGAAPAELATVASVALFLERARAASPDVEFTPESIPVVADICRQVEGLPLAIELAAARTRLLSPAELVTRLARRFDLLSGGPRDLPARHQTLRATIAWSYDLLSASEQTLVRALAVFAGGFTLAAVDGVCGSADAGAPLDDLAALVDRHLVNRVDRAGETRFTMMESIRAFALEALRDRGEELDARTRHAVWFHRWVTTTPELAEDSGLDRLEADHGNLRAALEWSRAQGLAAINLELAGALARFWHVRGYISEGRAFLESALASTAGTPTPERLTALIEAGTLANANGDYRRALTWFEQAQTAATALDDQARIAAVLNSIAGTRLELGEIDRAEALFSESLAIAERLGDRRRYAAALGNLGAVAHYRGDVETARPRYRDALAVRRELDDTFGIAIMLVNLLTLLAPFPEHLAEAIACGEEGLRCYSELGDRLGEAYALSGLGLIAEFQEDFQRAAVYYEESLIRFNECEDPSGVARAQGNLGMARLALGDVQDAVRLCRDSLRSFVALDEQDSIATLLDCLAAVAARVGESATAAHLLGAAEALRDAIGAQRPIEQQAQHERTLNAIRNRMGDRSLDTQRQIGRTCPLVESVRVAASFPTTTCEASTTAQSSGPSISASGDVR
jgi:predicted ATPase/class 3 adenylate cyclase